MKSNPCISDLIALFFDSNTFKGPALPCLNSKSFTLLVTSECQSLASTRPVHRLHELVAPVLVHWDGLGCMYARLVPLNIKALDLPTTTPCDERPTAASLRTAPLSLPRHLLCLPNVTSHSCVVLALRCGRSTSPQWADSPSLHSTSRLACPRTRSSFHDMPSQAPSVRRSFSARVPRSSFARVRRVLVPHMEEESEEQENEKEDEREDVKQRVEGRVVESMKTTTS